MILSKASSSSALVLLGRQTGITVIPAGTELTRLNYFDGKFLRAQDLQAEQAYLRNLVELSNRANGAGVVHGFDLTLAGGDRMTLGPGLAIDAQGRVLMLPQEHGVSIQDLINRSRPAAGAVQSSLVERSGSFEVCEEIVTEPGTGAVAGRDWYLITIGHAEALCGEEDVYGKLCEEACITTTDRPFRVEGVVLRATPLTLSTPLAQSNAVALDRTHLRSLIASAFFEDERKRVGSLISGAGLQSPVWCRGASPFGGSEVALGVLVREGSATLFLDEWIARRELMETSPRRYWQWRMAMRPWDVYLAQILQFQCQLHDRFRTLPPELEQDDPCVQAKKLVAEAAEHFQVLTGFYKETTARLAKMTRSVRDKLLEDQPALKTGLEKFALFQDRLVKVGQAFKFVPPERALIHWGFAELPPAGYLMVMPGSTVSVNQQVRRMMGEGVDLRFCIVRPDFVPHALEEAQHMERISLLEGLDHPERKPQVDVLVPNGRIAPDRVDTGSFYEMRLNLIPDNLAVLGIAARRALRPDDEDDGDAAKLSIHTNLTLNTDAFRTAYLAALSRAGEQREPETFEYSGAARTEGAPGQGFAFHFAGATRAFTFEAAQPKPAPAPAPAGTDQPIVGTAQPAGTTGATILNVNSGATLSLLRSKALAAVRAGPEARSSLWTSLEIDRDPSELARGQSARVKGECFVLLTLEAQKAAVLATNARAELEVADRSVLVRASFAGELQIEDQDLRPGRLEVRETKCVLAGELNLSFRQGTRQENFSLYLSEPVRILRTDGTYGPSYRIEAPEPSVLQPLVAELEVRRDWKSATQAEAIGVMSFRAPREQAQPAAGAPGAPSAGGGAGVMRLNVSAALTNALEASKLVLRQAFRAWQTINPAVREPNHPAHEAAIRALRSIGTALGGGKFADLAAKRLFPAPPPAGSELNVLATLDWVLFHRRRDKVCREEKPVAPIETRHYAVYHVTLTGDQSVDALRKLLERTGAQAAGLPALDFVQTVEFGAGIHAVVSSHTQLQASWRQDVGLDAGDIVGGIIASRGVAAAEGERLAQERIEALVEVLGVVVPVDARPDYEVMPRVPDPLDIAGNDGAIIVATRKAVATNCHDVVAVEREEELKQLGDAALAGRLEEALAASKTAKPLGKVNFTGAAPEQASLKAVQDQWAPLNLGKASLGIVVAAAPDTASASYPPQAAAIIAALGGSTTPGLVKSPKPMPGCPAMTIVAGSVERRNALLIYTNWDNGEHFIPAGAAPYSSPMEFRNNAPQGDALKSYIAGLTANQPVRGVTLATPQAAPDGGANARLKAVLDALVAAGLPLPDAARQVVEALSAPDRKQLETAGFTPNDYEDIIFFELNAG
jgi:hypothetical protein